MKITVDKEVLEQALEALNDNQHLVADNERHAYVMQYNSIIEKCEEALAQPERKPLSDEEIIHLVPGLLDSLCDPWDYNSSGDYYASIPKDMIRLARAIEAAHGITGESK